MKSELKPEYINSRITQCWSSILAYDNPLLTDDFFDKGGTSFKAMLLLIKIESDFGLAVPLSSFAENPTLEGLLAIACAPNDARSSSLVPMQPNGNKVPFFFVHAEFGHVYFAQGLAKALGQDQPMFGLQSSGLDGCEEPLADIPTMATHYIHAMKTVQPHGPYRVGGFCMGALLALEIACQLQDVGEEVSHLAIFNTDASWMRNARIHDHLKYHRREIGEAGLDKILWYVLSRIRFRLYRLYSSAILELNRLYAICGKSLPPKLRYVYIAELNYRAGWTFKPRPFQGTVSYFQGEADRHRDPLPFWQEFATWGIEIHSVAGELDSIFNQTHVDVLALALGDCLGPPVMVHSTAR